MRDTAADTACRKHRLTDRSEFTERARRGWLGGGGGGGYWRRANRGHAEQRGAKWDARHAGDAAGRAEQCGRAECRPDQQAPAISTRQLQRRWRPVAGLATPSATSGRELLGEHILNLRRYGNHGQQLRILGDERRLKVEKFLLFNSLITAVSTPIWAS